MLGVLSMRAGSWLMSGSTAERVASVVPCSFGLLAPSIFLVHKFFSKFDDRFCAA